MYVKEVPVPPEHATTLLDRVTFADCYEVAPVSKDHLTDLYWNIFTHSPAWITNLMALRNRIARRFGLKAAAPDEGNSTAPCPAPNDVQVGQRLGMFQVMKMADNLLVTGEDDSHLDFRIALSRTKDNRLRVTTVVQTKNTLGRVYMFVIKPFHKLIARTMITNALKAGRL
ncbi:DUF2867 domain-containing protein [Terasakiella pusilla]|uniref:DUF2867 domain-containing protein n=1 Tax=Terasakiella pusilla TaxID=64973 RepID=UPI00068A8AD9|nr:DUF2867 domain-containing protein [Terasakiella pusilla]